jgi:hypothetical protein
VISALDDVQPEVEGPPADADAPRGEAAIAAARKNLSKYWPL